VKIMQETRFPESGRVNLVVAPGRSTAFEIALRVPAWAKGMRVSVNGGPVMKPTYGPTGPSAGWLVLAGPWSEGDLIEIDLPMEIRAEPMADDPTTAALLQGPLVLAGRLGAEGLPATFPYAEPTKPRTVPEFKAEPALAPDLSRRPAAYPRLAPDETVRVTDKALVADRYADGQSTLRALGAKGESVPLTPFWKLQGERYAIYWKTFA
jgi:hypothetical protein